MTAQRVTLSLSERLSDLMKRSLGCGSDPKGLFFYLKIPDVVKKEYPKSVKVIPRSLIQMLNWRFSIF